MKYTNNHKNKFTLSRLFLAINAVILPFVCRAQPESPVITHGNIELSQAGNQLNITQTTQHAIANWQSFSINEDESVNIQQLNANSALLNRVTGSDPSQLLGQLTSNGQVYLINPNGILVGNGAQINAGEFIASTLDISDADFLNGGELLFTGDSTSNITNFGSITSSNGDVVLIASSITNNGTIAAPNGLAALAAGNEVLLANEENQRLIVRSAIESVNKTGIDNDGVIEATEAALVAAGGSIYDLAINQSGIIKATGVENKNGRILLTSDSGNIEFSGQISAHNVDGSGGKINIGGGLQGNDSSIVTAANTLITERATIDVSSSNDRAGEVIIWADNNTDFFGTVNANATGLSENDAGFVEVSGKHSLNFRGQVDLSSESGSAGTLLLDPDKLTIQASDPGDNVLLVSTLEAQLATGNVILDTGSFIPFDANENSTITINDAVAWTSGNSLSLKVSNDININADLNGGAANINLMVGFVEPVDSGSGPTASLVVDNNASIIANTLTVTKNPDAQITGSNSFDGAIGSILINGMLDVSTLDIQLNPVDNSKFNSSEVNGNVIIDNAANQIEMLTNGGTGSTIGGLFTVVDSSGGLNVSGSFEAADTVTINTVGNLSLLNGTNITTTDTNVNIILAAQNGSFINNAGTLAINPYADESFPESNGRFLIYSDNPDNTSLGGIIAAPVYNKSWEIDSPSSITAIGNRVLYELAPTLILTANNNEREEGSANPTLTYSISGLVGDDVASDVFSGTPLLSTTANAGSSLGDYLISIANGSVTLSDYGYGLSLQSGTLSIVDNATSLLTVTANDLSRIYGDQNPNFTANITGFKSGEDASVVSGLQFSTTATLESSVGTYSIIPFGATADDYNFSYVPGTLTINQRDLMITANSTDKIFGEVLSPLAFTVTGLASFDTHEALGTINTSTSGLSRLSSVGNYAVVPSGATNPNYNITYVNGNLNITPADLTITTHNISRIYGTANPAFSISTSGLVTGDSLNTTGLTFSTTATSNSDVGTYDLIASGITDPNYNINFVPGSLNITPAQLTLSVDSAFRDYGSTNPTFTYTSAGLTAGDAISNIINNTSLSTSATQSSNAGIYNINLTTNLLSNNYKLTINKGTLRINKVDVDLFLSPASRLYGDPNPAPELIAYGLVNGDSSAVFNNVDVNYLVAETSDVGTYTAQLLGASSVNYNIKSLNNGILNVLPRPLTIRANNATREYGETNPEFTVTFDGLASFDDESDINGLTISTTATPKANVLEYGIDVTAGSNPNYIINTFQGILTVTPAPISISISDYERFYFENNEFPLLLAEYSDGLKFDDTFNDLNLQLTSDAILTSDVGEYSIRAISNNPNYEVDMVNTGTLFIRPVDLTVNLKDITTIYGEESNRTFNDYFSGASGLKTGQIEDVLTITSPEITTHVGKYQLEASLNTDNYNLTVNGGEFTIIERNIAIKPENILRIYGDQDTTYNYIVAGDGLASFDTIDDVVSTNNLLVDGDFGEYASVGLRTSLAQLTNNPNYIVTNVPGLYVVFPRPIQITVDDADAVGNFPLPGFNASATNLASFDTLFTAFPNSTFRIFRDNEPAPIQVVSSTPETFEVPELFKDDVMLTRFPSRISDPTAEYDSNVPTVSEIDPIEIIDIIGSNDTMTGVVVSNSFIIPSNFFSTEEQSTDQSVTQYIQFYGSNPNYRIVSNTSGLLNWTADPSVVAKRQEIAAELAIFEENRASFWETTSNSGDNFMGLPTEALPNVILAIQERLLLEESEGESSLAFAIERAGGLARGTASRNLTGAKYQDFDLYAFLEAAKTVPAYAQILGEIMSEYVMDLIEVDPATYSPAQQALADHMSSHIETAQQGIANKAKEKYNAWAEQESNIRVNGMSNLYGTSTPYDEFIGDAASDFLVEHIAGQSALISGGIAATAAITTTVGTFMATATSVVLPYTASVHSITTSIIASGGTVSSAIGTGVGAATMPIGVITIALVGSITRAVQVMDEVQQKEVYESLANNQPMQLSDLHQTRENGESNTLNQIIMATALSSMFSSI